jgi:hypothetical protein
MAKRLTKNKVKDLLKQAQGNYAAVARAYGVSRQAVQKYVSNDAELSEVAQEARETMLDNAESKLYSEAMNGNTAALIFLLKTQGKRRGYIERAEIQQDSTTRHEFPQFERALEKIYGDGNSDTGATDNATDAN